MKLFVGVTDPDWFGFLRDTNPSEVNFWRPGGQNFAALDPGELFLFKLKSPYDAIAGGGFFVRFTQLPLTLAWDVFGQKNGAPDYSSYRDRLIRLRRTNDVRNPTIGCIILTAPFFLDREDWMDVPDSFAKNIVSGKTYDSVSDPDAEDLWRAVQTRLDAYRIVGERDDARPSPQIVAEELVEYGAPYIANNRLGQSAFRAAVTDAYERRCSFTGEKTLPALQASHIKPYASSGPHRVDNGLLLRADLHQLFDRGYITITRDYRIEVSRRIKEEFNNGKAYLGLHGQQLHTHPSEPEERPSEMFIEHHNTSIYVG